MITGKKILVTSRGGNREVISTILEVLSQQLHTCDYIVQELKGLDIVSQCYSIFDFVVSNVRYIEDAGNNQYVKTPARTLEDGFADCKSMAILVYCCCNALDIPCELRFVDFKGNGIYTHVYVVARDEATGEEIVIDPVERVDGQPAFNYCSKFVDKLSYVI